MPLAILVFTPTFYLSTVLLRPMPSIFLLLLFNNGMGILVLNGITLTGLCDLCTDGAAVMVGQKSGVVTRLKAEVPGVLVTHCIAHR